MCTECDYEFFIDRMEEMLEESNLSKSDQMFIEDVFEWVESNEHITDRQKYYVNKIYDKG